MAGVRLLLPDASVLYEVCPFDGMRAKELFKVLKAGGYKGVLLDAQGFYLSPGKPVTGGDDFTFREEEPKDDAWFLKHAGLASPSQLANSVAAMASALGTGDPICRTSASTVPLPLANESFRCYLKHLGSCVLDAIDWHFVYNSMAMSNFYPDEHQRQNVFLGVLEEYLASKMPNVNFKVIPSSKLEIQVEALIAGEWVLLLLVEIKPELGLSGELCVEVLRHYADHFIARRSTYHWTYFRSCCPVLILEVVGATIRVGGAAFFDKPAYEPFTPYLHIYKFLQDRDHLEQLSKALASIGAAVSSLVAFYASVSQQQGHASQRVRDRMSWPDLILEEHRQGAVVTQYSLPAQTSQLRQQHMGREKLLLFSLIRPDSKRIVKFCQRYGVEVHQQWAALGYAPPVSYKELDGKWLAVDMEYLTEADGWRPLMALDPRLFDPSVPGSFNMYRLQPADWEACKAAVKSAYLAVHAAHPNHVHGDLRRQNILYNVQTCKVAFIDFDWAGVEGRELYPIFINPVVSWPLGVGRCQPMMTLLV